MLVNTVLPQIVAQIESVSTFGSTTSDTDVGSIKVAQVTCDRFLKGVHEIAVAENLLPVISELLEDAFGDNFDVTINDEWTLTLPTRFKTGADSIAVVIALRTVTSFISALSSKKRKAPERGDLDVNVGITNETLMHDSFPHTGDTSEERIRMIRRQLHYTASGASDWLSWFVDDSR